MRALAISAAAAAAASAIFATSSARADDETRRQVMSSHVDQVFNATGNGIVIGQVEVGVPIAHTNVARTLRTGEAPGAGDPSLHALEVAGIMVSTHATHTGMAPNAQLYSDNINNNGIAAGGGGSAGENNFLDSIFNFTMDVPAAHVVNASFGFATNTFASNGATKATLGLDWAITQPRADGGDFLFVKSSGNNGTMPVTVPGDNFNGLSVGAVTSEDYQVGTTQPQGTTNHRWGVLADFTSWGVSTISLSKPDIVAPGGRIDTDDPVGGNSSMEQGFVMATGDPLAANGFAANNTGAGGAIPNRVFVGTSYAAPHVSGIAAQLYQLAPDTNHRTMKAVLMNSADKTVRECVHGPAGGPHGVFWRSSDPPWTAGAHGLDAQLGAGMVDAWGATANLMDTGNSRVGTSTGNLANGANSNVLTLPVGPDTRVVATVVWDRAITQAGAAFPDDTYAANANQPHYALSTTGAAALSQNTAGGSVQHINAIVGTAGNLTINVANNGTAAGAYSIAYAVSPVDVNPGEGEVFFTVRDQIHRPRAERTPATGNDRILEGRPLSTVNNRAQVDSSGLAVGVDSSIYRSTFDASTSTKRTGTELGLMEVGGVNPDDHVNDISFGHDAIRPLYQTGGGGEVYFSVDAYATGLSPVRAGHSRSGVYSEATIVHEAAGDVFLSNFLLPGDQPVQNNNARTKNTPNPDFLRPVGNDARNFTYADSYYMGLVGGRVADHEDDVTGLEGLGKSTFDPNYRVKNGLYFFSLDRGSPSGHLGEILVAREDMPGQFRVFTTPAQLGLNNTDNIDGLCVELFGDLGADGWPVYDPARDLILFSVDRDSTGVGGTALRTESEQGEVAGDLFFASVNPGNMLFLEATDLGLQEFALGNSRNWLSDNLDAIDLPDVVPEPAACVMMTTLALAATCARRRRRDRVC